MLVPSKGNTVEIAPGERFVERNHADPQSTYYMEALCEPEVKAVSMFGEEGLRYKWKAKNLATGDTVEFIITDFAMHYGPMLFQTFEDSEESWNHATDRLVRAVKDLEHEST